MEMKKKKLIGELGFTIIEIMVVLTLIAMIGTFVVTNVISRLEEGKVNAVKIQIRSLMRELKNYRRICHRYPSSEQGLEALLSAPVGEPQCTNYPEGGFIEAKTIPLDPWDTPYFYESDGKNFEITSLGADKAPDGEGNDADIKSSEL